MLLSQVIQRVRDTVGDTDVLQFTNGTLIDWVNDGIRECAVDNNLLQKRGTIPTVIGQSAYDLPTDILKLHSIKYAGIKIRLSTLNEFDDKYPIEDLNSTSGQPEFAYLWAGKINLVPAPDRVESLVVDYIMDPPALTVDDVGEAITLPVAYHSRIVDYCLAQVAQQDDDLNRYNSKMEEFRTGVTKLRDQAETEEDLYPFINTSVRDMGQDYREDFYG